MASVQFNISKGREVEFYNRVDNNDPANSALIMMVLKTGSANGVNGLVDFDTFAAILAGGYTEVTNTNYTRKTLTDADLTAWTPDDTNNWVRLTLPLQSWLNISSGDSWDIVVVGYDNDTTGGTDANIVPVTGGEIRESGTAIVPNTSTVVIDFSSVWITAT
jgi:sirohydrochlorin ferrochelatase